MSNDDLIGFLFFYLVVGYGVAAFFTGISSFLDRAGGLIFVVIAPALVIGMMMSLILLGNIADGRVTTAYVVGFLFAFRNRN